jgi:preprotein translocase subunit SecF
MNLVGKIYWYFAFSVLILVSGIMSLCLYGLKLSIDSTGASRIQYQISDSKHQAPVKEIQDIVAKQKVEISSVQESSNSIFIIRTKPLDQKTHQRVQDELKKKFPNGKELSFETVGPTIGGETTINAIKSVVLASLLIVLYIAWSFRKVPKPASSFRFGICAVTALLHDILVVVGIFSILGHFYHVEVDSLFVTAVLTVIGFSVHDTIVVFDRIRENLRRMGDVPFATVVNESIIQTLGRSFNTSLTVLLVLFTMLLFGGESIRWFVVALFVGILSGTYSSIFNASPLLVVWEDWSRGR